MGCFNNAIVLKSLNSAKCVRKIFNLTNEWVYGAWVGKPFDWLATVGSKALTERQQMNGEPRRTT